MQSIWHSDNHNYKGKRLEGNMSTEVLVIGGGMAGILCAYKLKQIGVPCVVVEGKKIGSGVTGNTTAKITAQHGLIYDRLIKKQGLMAARQYYEINQQAVTEFRSLAEHFPCDFEQKNAYVYSSDSIEKLELEQTAYARLSIPHMMQEQPPIPVAVKAALGMEYQAQFHPLRLLYALAQELEVFEDSMVQRLDGSKAITEHGVVAAKHIILATHFPMVNIPGLYFMKLYQHRSYVIALENGPQLPGMYVDEQMEGHSFRNYQNYLLIGGGDHKTGKEGGGLAELQAISKKEYPEFTIKYAWAAQDCMSLDSIPYIGRHRAGRERLYVATGFNKWGMTGSMTAAQVICDLIMHGRSELQQLFSPRRSMLTLQLAENLGSSAVGLLSAGKPRCTHMGCKLRKNSVEDTWDCPCHGSRFSGHGQLIKGPAKRDIDHG